MTLTVFRGGSVWTGVVENLLTNALAIDGEKIIALGSDALALESSADKVIDLADGLLIPAFGDGHMHPIFGGLEEIGPKITQSESLQELLMEVKRYADENPDKEWIIGASYKSWFVEGGNFDAKWLDDVVPDRPVVLRANDYHTIWCNSKALELSGVNELTPNPALGEIVHRADGSVMGTMREWGAVNLILDNAPAIAQDEFNLAFNTANRHLGENGITWAQDAWVDEGSPENYLEAMGSDYFGVRYNLALRADPVNWRKQIAWFTATRDLVGDKPHLTCKTIKFFVDGVIEGGTAALKKAYIDAPESLGMPCWSWEELTEAVIAVDALGFQPHLHAIGDEGIFQALNAIEAAQLKNAAHSHPRPVITHVQLVDPVDLKRFAELKVIANFEPLWACDDPLQSHLTTPRLGPERASWQYPINSLLDNNSAISFGSDWPVSTLRPLDCLEIAVTRTHQLAEQPKPWMPDERISVDQALSAYTYGTAFQAGDETHRGQLIVGFDADLVLLDRNIRETDPKEIHKAKIQGTWILGKRIFTSEASW